MHCTLCVNNTCTVVVQSLSHIRLFVIPWTAACQASLFFTVSLSLIRFMSIESVMLSNISSSVTPFSSCLQSSRSFPIIQLFASGGQNIGDSVSASVFPMNIQGCFPLGLTSLISLLSKRLSRVFSSTTIWKHQICCSTFFVVQLSYPYMADGKTTALTVWTFDGKVIFLLFNTLSRFIITFLPRSKCLLISQLQSPYAVILEPPKLKSLTVSIVSPSIWHEGWDQMPWSSFSECWALSQLFHSPLSLPSRGSLFILHFLP